MYCVKSLSALLYIGTWLPSVKASCVNNLVVMINFQQKKHSMIFTAQF